MSGGEARHFIVASLPEVWETEEARTRCDMRK